MQTWLLCLWWNMPSILSWGLFITIRMHYLDSTAFCHFPLCFLVVCKQSNWFSNDQMFSLRQKLYLSWPLNIVGLSKSTIVVSPLQYRHILDKITCTKVSDHLWGCMLLLLLSWSNGFKNNQKCLLIISHCTYLSTWIK